MIKNDKLEKKEMDGVVGSSVLTCFVVKSASSIVPDFMFGEVFFGVTSLMTGSSFCLDKETPAWQFSSQ